MKTVQVNFGLVLLAAVLAIGSRAIAQNPSEATDPSVTDGQGDGAAPVAHQPVAVQPVAPQPAQQSPASLSGTVVDQSGAVVAGAHVQLTETQLTGTPSPSLESFSGSDGQFFFPSIPSGPFQLTVISNGFTAQTISGVAQPGEVKNLPPVALAVANAVTEVQVKLTAVEVAEEQIKIEEKQRVLGIIPNFYVSYVPDAAPMNWRQKFRLAARTSVDPFTLFVVAGAAAVEQGQNHFAEYGQGAQGYGKRFGASYADTVFGTFIGGAILPSLLRQDPRYFYKGTGTIPSRSAYAVGMAVICRGDNRRWQPNYSAILGSLAAGGLSNLYYPEQDRNGAGLTFENAAIGIFSTALTNLLQEFIVPKFTPRLHKNNQQTP